MGNSVSRYRMPLLLWTRMQNLIPPRPRTTAKGGRPPIKHIKAIADGIFYKMRTGCQWNAIPRVFGASSTIHDYFQRWVGMGLFEKMWELALNEYDELVGVAWRHQSIDASIVKSPLGGKKNGSKSNRPRQAGLQTVGARGRQGRPIIVRDQWSQLS